uniref:Putative Na+ channel toxin n=1 Tax=Superstitionia donensis TaxID=311983 RepID=A0A1V1WBR1_9SCOR
MNNCTCFILCLVALIYEFGNAQGKDGYPLNDMGNTIFCVMVQSGNEKCEKNCKERGGHGYCYALRCYCKGMKNNVKIWE